jgi:alpha-beta hydrolase superfamily lysophospholipase
MDHAEGSFQGHNGLALYYQGWRPEGSPRAVLAVVHGFGEHSSRYGNVVDWFVPKGYTVYAFDQRGHGRSPGNRGHVDSADEIRGDVRAFLDRVRNEESGKPVFLLGHSMGGLIVLDYVLHDPSKLAGVIASGPMLSQPGISPLLLQLSKLLARVWPTLAMDVGLDTTALSRDQAVVDAYVSDPLVHGKTTPRAGGVLMATIDWTQAHAADLALPLLIVHGGADRLCDPAASRAFFEHVTFADKQRFEYESYYHEVFNDVGKERVLADVEAWLEQHLVP